MLDVSISQRRLNEGLLGYLSVDFVSKSLDCACYRFRRFSDVGDYLPAYICRCPHVMSVNLFLEPIYGALLPDFAGNQRGPEVDYQTSGIGR